MENTIESLEHLDDLELLTALLMGEAEGEPMLGKMAVAWTVKNRVYDTRWPTFWKDVMLQPYQFSCFLPAYFRPEILKHEWDTAWRECKYTAFGVYHGWVNDVTDGANHYCVSTLDPKPRWVDPKRVTLMVGGHTFYRL